MYILIVKKDNTCISQYCSQIPEHFHLDKTVLNTIFYKTISGPLPQWLLAVETATLQVCSMVHDFFSAEINSQTYVTKTYHEGEPLPLGTFVLKRSF